MYCNLLLLFCKIYDSVCKCINKNDGNVKALKEFKLSYAIRRTFLLYFYFKIEVIDTALEIKQYRSYWRTSAPTFWEPYQYYVTSYFSNRENHCVARFNCQFELKVLNYLIINSLRGHSSYI